MDREYKKLNNPPVVMALFQLRYSSQHVIQDFEKCYDQLHEIFPIKSNHMHVGIDLGKTAIPLGESKVVGKTNATIDCFMYTDVNQTKKLTISSDTITYIDESPYQGWEQFKEGILSVLKILSPLHDVEIKRTSIRFINRFLLPEFDNPEKYVNTIISSVTDSSEQYPLVQYGFKLQMEIPNSDIYTIVNHQVDHIEQEQFAYVLDIDVLDKQNLVYNQETISSKMDALREVRNHLFFSTITDKMIELCN